MQATTVPDPQGRGVWESRKDPGTGRVFWVNHTLKETKWHPPAAPATAGWEAFVTVHVENSQRFYADWLPQHPDSAPRLPHSQPQGLRRRQRRASTRPWTSCPRAGSGGSTRRPVSLDLACVPEHLYRRQGGQQPFAFSDWIMIIPSGLQRLTSRVQVAGQDMGGPEVHRRHLPNHHTAQHHSLV